MRLAVIADIHGNVLALEAVLSDIAKRGCDLTVDLGDCVSGPLWPRETFELLATQKFPTVRGNHERQVALEPRAQMGATDAFTHDRLTATQLASLAALPLSLSPCDGVLAFHATPQDDNTPLLEATLPTGGFTLARRESILQRLGGIQHEVILCGHTHQQRLVTMSQSDGTAALIVNPGSVGLPAFEDGGQFFNSGSPHARYAVLTKTSQAWTCELHAVDYDWHSAAGMAKANNRDGWAQSLATGFAG